MHCNLRPLEPRQPFSALITTPCQVSSRWTYPWPYYSVFVADTLLYAVTLTYDPMTLTFDLWPWTFAAYRLWRDKTVYQIWMQSCNTQRSYCDFSAWPYDLGHCVICCARPSTTYPCLNFDADMFYHAVTLTFDPLTWKVCGTSRVTWSKSVRNLSKLEQSPAELINNFANLCTRYVMLWSWPLISWPWTLTALRMWCV